MGVNWDDCVLWVGLPVITQDGTQFGMVGDIVFDRTTGAIEHLEVNAGATANALLGVREIPASMIKGFRRGVGAALTTYDEEGEEPILGAIMVDNAAKQVQVEGGIAEKAGEATAIAGNKVHEAVDDVVKPAAHAAGKAVNKGAYVTGRQLTRAKGMFSNFKSEYDKASGKSASAGKSGQAGKSATAGKSVAAAKAAVAKAAANPEATKAAAVAAVGAAGEKAKDAAQKARAKIDDTFADKYDEDIEIVYVDEDGNEIVYVDEDGNEIVYVDEDGNVIDVEDDDDFVIVAGRA